MDFSKVFQISSDYKDRIIPPSLDSRLFAEVVFIDKTHPSVPQKAYQLQDSYVPKGEWASTTDYNSTPLTEEAFFSLGEIVSIDRHKKQIVLKNQNTISYNHLVIVSGKKPLLSFDNEELITAIQALNDALRVKPKIPSSFAPSIDRPTPIGLISTPMHATVSQKEMTCGSSIPKHIQDIVKPLIADSINHDVAFELDILNKRLYEVQL